MKFFVVTPPGLEATSKWEIEYWWPFLLTKPIEINRVKGGLEVEGPLEFVELNKYLKSASRILLRQSSFAIKQYQDLTEHLKSFRPVVALPSGSPKFQVSAKNSKCSHKERLAKSCEMAKLDYEAGFHVRIVDDQATLSIDTSGDHLYKRGYRKAVGAAPIRENLAAGLLIHELKTMPLVHWQGIQWLDPMMGSATFLTEAHGLFEPMRWRSYDYEKWHQDVTMAPRISRPKWLFAGADLEIREVDTAKLNWTFDSNIQLLQEDLMSADSGICLERDKLWIVSNLPYGERVKGDWKEKVIRCAEKFEPWRMSFLVPRIKSANRLSVRGFRLQSVLNLSNGGIPVSWLSFQQSKSSLARSAV